MMAGVLLAAGASTRMGTPKATVREGRDSFLANGVRHLWGACDAVVVVLGAGAAAIKRQAQGEFEALVASGRLRDELVQARRKGANGLEVHFTFNPRWRHGMLSSVRIGLEDALELKPAGVMVLPVDHPAVRSFTVASLAQVMLDALAACRSARERSRFCYALVPRFHGRRGHPVVLSPALAHAIAEDRVAESLSDAIRRNARLVGYLDVADRGVVVNRNTPRG
jgi:CTP:molybdopterin cytidylyltransferase MocA